MFFPEGESDDNTVVPIDVSGLTDDFQGDYEIMIEKLGTQETLKAVVKAEKFFQDNKKLLSEKERPIEMTIGQWKKAMEDSVPIIFEEGEGEEEELEIDEPEDGDAA